MKKANGGRAGAEAEVAVRASRPIIFDSESMQAIRSGCKKQTRRVMDWPGWCDTPLVHRVVGAPYYGYGERGEFVPLTEMGGMCAKPFSTQRFSVPCRYGKPGDLLWVRERMHWGKEAWVYSSDGEVVHYDKAIEHVAMSWSFHKEAETCSPIHMPRWASRLTLRLTDVRVHRAQEITEADAKAEGVFWDDLPLGQQKKVERKRFVQQYKGRPDLVNDMDFARVAAFEVRWDAINAKRGYPWATNPWVWALTFEPIWQNIDAVLKAEPGSAVRP